MRSRLVVALGRQIDHHCRDRKLTRSRYNIEAMATFLPVDKFFEQVYLVDLSPSLCEVARQRFERLGWKNVTVLCQDARSFRLPERVVDPRSTNANDGVDLVTMSYSLSMIPGKCQWECGQSQDIDSFRLLQRCRLINFPPEADWYSGCV
jgi:SAM-dependent methyltransferase